MDQDPTNDGMPGVHNPLYSAPITSQLSHLYVMLQEFYPDWCRDNPFWSLVQGHSHPQLCELHVTWTQWVEYAQAQLCAPVPVL